MASDKTSGKDKPLETLTIIIEENGVTKKVPALSSYFATNRPMTNFVSPPKCNDEGEFLLGAKDSWLNKMNIFKGNIQWLLGLPYHRFWSQIVYGKNSWDSVITFLQEAYPFYILDNLTQDFEISHMYFEIYYLVFQLIKRATTRKESEKHWIGVKEFGNLLYNHTIVSFPIAIDICVIYGEHFKDEVQKLINRVFTAQSKYKEDLNNSIPSIKNIFQTLENQFSDRSILPGEMTRLADRKELGTEMSITKVQDIVFYLLDVSASLSTFLNFCPEAASILHLHNFETNISSLYESIVPTLSNSIKKKCFKDDSMSTYFNLMLKLNHARYFLISLYRQCLEPTLNIILTKSGDAGDPTLTMNCDNYIDTLSNSFCYKVFITDYNNKFAIESELDMMMQICPDLDSEKYSFLKDSLINVCGNPPPNPPKYQPNLYDEPIPGPSTQNDFHYDDNLGATALINDQPEEKDVHILITEVKDIFPHLGDGFILNCIEHFKTSSAVINAILEDNLPANLNCLDRELPFIPPEEEVLKKDPVLRDRVNVFDYDDYDVMTRDDVDLSRMHKGKRKDQYKSFNELINDKTFREEFRSKYSELGIIESVVDVYDDEYDDTYDGFEVVAPEVGELEKKFTIPRVLRQREEKELSEYEEDEEEEETTNGHRKFDQFVENPEDVRKRYEQRRMTQTRTFHPAPRTVTGDPKDPNVMKNRRNKDVHKSSAANHNRKKGAKNKRMHGLVPS